MLNVRTGSVVEIIRRREGAVECRVAPDDAPEAVREAILYPALAGEVEAGDRVLLNTTAVDLSLGTGGWDFIVANLTRAEGATAFGEATTGHLMKLRYTPQQIAVQAAEETDTGLPETLGGIPVLVGELHSQLVPALLGVKGACEAAGAPYPRVGYVMPDTAALPLAFSETVPLLRERGLLHAAITCGQAFGGDYEAVSLGSGLILGAGPAACDLLVVIQGPGNAGTGSALGFGGLYQAEALHLAYALGGHPILIPRISAADPRPRHRGLSHHTRTLLECLILAPVTIVFAQGEGVGLAYPELPHNYAVVSHPGQLHRTETVPAERLLPLCRETDLPLRSMGRGLSEDADFFLTAAAGGWVAGERVLAKKRTQEEAR